MQSNVYEFWQAEAEVELRRLAEEPDTEAKWLEALSQVTHDKSCSICDSFVVWDRKIFIVTGPFEESGFIPPQEFQ